MIKIGLCGHSGAGKGYVCNLFSEFGIPSIDTDKVYHELLKPINNTLSECALEIKENFGESVINKDNTINRSVLSDIVFSSEESLKTLNNIVHKHILKETNSIIKSLESLGHKAVIIDAPVLFESGFNSICDYTICVTSPLNVSIKRIIERDKISKENAIKRLSSQLTDEQLIELCNFEIINDGIADTQKQVKNIITKIL